MQPASFSPWRKAATRKAEASCPSLWKNPIVGGVAVCCARATNGHANEPHKFPPSHPAPTSQPFGPTKLYHTGWNIARSLEKTRKYGVFVGILASKGCRIDAAALPMADEIS
jgi:hypothetical protein